MKDWMSQSQLHGPSIGSERWGILDISFLSKSKFLAVMSSEGTWEQVIFFKPSVKLTVISDEEFSGSILGRLQVDGAFSIEAWENRFGLPKL